MKTRTRSLPLRFWLTGLALALAGTGAGAAKATSAPVATAPIAEPAADSTTPSFFSTFKDPEDGYFDATEFVLSKHGFLAMPIIITEPATGYGGGLALLFLNYAPEPPPGAPPPQRYVSPSIMAVAGGMTENGTWSGGLIHMGVWQEDNLRYLGALGRAHAVLKYYGNGGGGPGFGYEADAWMLLQQLGRVSSQDFSNLADADDVFGHGVGLRDTIARKLGIKTGIDFARSKDDSSFYIVMGSAWPC